MFTHFVEYCLKSCFVEINTGFVCKIVVDWVGCKVFTVGPLSTSGTYLPCPGSSAQSLSLSLSLTLISFPKVWDTLQDKVGCNRESGESLKFATHLVWLLETLVYFSVIYLHWKTFQINITSSRNYYQCFVASFLFDPSLKYFPL